MTNGMTRQLILNSLFLLAALLICGQASAQVSTEHARIIEQSEDLAAFKQYLAEHGEARACRHIAVRVECEGEKLEKNEEGRLQVITEGEKHPWVASPWTKYILLDSSGKITLFSNSNWKIADLSFFSKLQNLKGLYLSSTHLKDLSLTIKGYPSLQELVLYDMRIKSAVLDIKSKKLKYVSFFDNPLLELKGLGQHISIENLVLVNTQLRQIDGLDKLSNLKFLNVSFSQVQTLGDLKHLPNLEKLELGKSKVIDLPHIHTLKNLTLLDACLAPASKNTKIFPKSLKELRLIHEELKQIPADIANLKNLESLRVTGSVEKIEHISGLPNLKKLILTGNNITKIENLRDLPKIEVLYLSHNPITKIEGLDSLCSLKKLYLNNTKINKIENLEKLGNLVDLYLEDTPIKSIETLDVIYNVKYLDLFESDIEYMNIDELSNRDIELNAGYTPFRKKIERNNERLYYQLLRENKL
jgi:internalin A